MIRRIKCLLLHWERQRDSYASRCSKCGLDW